MERTHVSSSNVRSVGYDAQSMTLEVEFHGGGVYRYGGVPSSVYSGLMGSGSKGAYLADHIKDRYPTSKVR